ncbi:GPI mannosyltransferase 2 [Cytospora mali]|uniref:GPI mannosyltransferase 2 n=1 Tax=Cytospora mali TaxID=578113 RepID=A0A194UP45_CYTMA|nr:GPI mannosyltransferase 2 [Valsa mali var. pyri (nom. inval.)]
MSAVQNGHPYRTLTTVFVAWKTFLFAIAAGSQVGPTYDTSSSLLAPDGATGPSLITRLTSWDAIYFVSSAQRGYLFEQEWAFSSALPKCISYIIRALQTSGASLTGAEPLIGVIFSSICHLLSVFVLYRLGLHVWKDSKWALVSALLHVLSPAGLFLSAPYAESACSLLSFSGWLLLVKSCTGSTSTSRDALTILAGATFGLATYFRTNGLLNGAPLAFEFLLTIYNLIEDLDQRKTLGYIRRLVVLGISGMAVAAGSVVPQVLAYQIYCTSGSNLPEVRPWCAGLVPSIYNHVQRQYWNTGFLRYWTLSNTPLFLLAAPMLFVMGKSGKDIFLQASRIPQAHQAASNLGSQRLQLVVRSMVFAQVLLVVVAFTSYHVQIITRLSSGYPAWYWWVAACLRSPKTRSMGSGLVVFMVMYASIQAVLFASFLPPA